MRTVFAERYAYRAYKTEWLQLVNEMLYYNAN